MAKKRVPKDELERLILERIRAYPDCENVKRVSVYRTLEGDRSWRVSFYDAEAPADVVNAVELELSCEYDLSDD